MGALRPRNDRDFHMGCGARPFSGRPGGRPLHTSIVKRSVGADAHIGPVAPALKKSVGRRLDAPPLPTRTITARWGHPALRKRNKMCRARVTARVAPTGAWQEVRRVLCLRGRRRGYPCSTKAARVRVSGQRMAAHRRCESKTVNLKGWFAGQVGVHAGHAPGAEGFQNHGF